MIDQGNAFDEWGNLIPPSSQRKTPQMQSAPSDPQNDARKDHRIRELSADDRAPEL